MSFYPGTGSGTSALTGPWLFTPETYGAKGNGTLVSDGAITSTQHTLTCATSAPFASAQAGMTVYVVGAGAAGADLFTTISAVLSATQVSLAAAAGTTVTGKGVVFGTDDTAAIQAAIAAAVTYAQSAEDAYAQIVFKDLVYLCNAPATIGGVTKGNSILTLPVIPMTSQKVVLSFKGVNQLPSLEPFNTQAVPSTSGTVLLTTRLDGTVDGTYWQAFILGGPYQGYGGGGTTFSNMQVNLDGITFAGPWNTTYGGGGFLGIAALRVLSAGMSVLAVFSAASSSTWPTLAVGGPSSVSTALVTPDINNGTPADITYFTALGIATGVRALEHVAFQSIYAQCCITALDATDPSTTGAAHINVTGKYLSAENCVSAVANFTGAVSKVDIDVIDLENTTYAVNDTTPAVTGQVGVTGNYSAHYGAIAVNGAANVKIKDLMQSAGAVTSPQAAPATTVAWANSYYRDAEITCSISGGTLTTLSIGGPGGAVAQTIPASTTFYRFTLPAGRAYTPAYTGSLTHTVTLL